MLYQENYSPQIQELVEFLSIPSISTSPDHTAEVARCAQWLANKMREIGIGDVSVVATNGHPLVYASLPATVSGAPTVLVYGHYDVQPVDPIELWSSDPFTPVVHNDVIYARGANDDKGQVFLHLIAVREMLNSGAPRRVNLKFLIEGEEEIGSPHLSSFISENAALLACDAVLVSDTPMFDRGIPAIVFGLRGLAYAQIDVTGPNRDLHSGSYGGSLMNPIEFLIRLLTKMKDENGRIVIPGFYDDVVEISNEERDEISSLDFDPATLKNDVGVLGLHGEVGWSALEQMTVRPTLEINGIIGGFTGVGAKTVLPSKASAKISMRLVPNQNAADVMKKVRAFVDNNLHPGVGVTVTDLQGADPVLVDRGTRFINVAVTALEDVYGTKCRFIREGGSIPVVELFDKLLNAPTVLMGFGLKTENAHSPDEHFHLENFRKGISVVQKFYSLIGND